MRVMCRAGNRLEITVSMIMKIRNMTFTITAAYCVFTCHSSAKRKQNGHQLA